MSLNKLGGNHKEILEQHEAGKNYAEMMVGIPEEVEDLMEETHGMINDIDGLDLGESEDEKGFLSY